MDTFPACLLWEKAADRERLLCCQGKAVTYWKAAARLQRASCYAKALADGRGNGQMYSPRGMQGQSYDKGALDWVNEQLGHGAGRYDVAVYNYLSYGG